MTDRMQWKPDDQGGGTVEVIVAWVNANGGEARYENDPPEGALADDLVSRARVREAYLRRGTYARILIKQRDGSEAVCLPGQWVVKGDDWFVHNIEGWAGGKDASVQRGSVTYYD